MARPDLLASLKILKILRAVMGGSLKASGLGDGLPIEPSHPQAALEAATRRLIHSVQLFTRASTAVVVLWADPTHFARVAFLRLQFVEHRVPSIKRLSSNLADAGKWMRSDRGGPTSVSVPHRCRRNEPRDSTGRFRLIDGYANDFTNKLDQILVVLAQFHRTSSPPITARTPHHNSQPLRYSRRNSLLASGEFVNCIFSVSQASFLGTRRAMLPRQMVSANG